MADKVFNIAKGRVAELYNRVQTNDPSTARLVMIALATSGLESDATLIDKDTLAALVSGTTNEVTNTGYSRKNITDADISAISPDDTNDRMDLDIPDQTFSSVGAGDGWSKIVLCYDPNAGGGDSAIIPLTMHDVTITPDGNDIQIVINAAGFYRAS